MLNYLKYTLLFLLIATIILYIVSRCFQASIQPIIAEQTATTIKFSATRLVDQPIIHLGMHPKLQAEAKAYGYTNINGPSLIKVPDWVENKLGKYYCYFAHHKGKFLRLAYADSLQGPWVMYDQEIIPVASSGFATEATPALGLLALKKHLKWTELIAMSAVGSAAKKAWEERTKQKMKSSPPTTPHVASPEIFIDEKTKKIRLYYHGVVDGNLQMSKVALSNDGLVFQPQPSIITLPYLRIFPFRNEFYGFTMPGFFYRSKDGLSNFEIRDRWLFDTNVRHSALYLDGNDLYIFYSQVGDAPEQILYSKVDLSSTNWNDWKATPPITLLKPALEWEGSKQPIQPSMRGEMGVMVNQLRDPAIFEEDGQLYLLYTGAGEQAIGIAKLEKEEG